MDTLDKYELIISKIQEMCTSTVAMAPYPVGATSITTYKYGKSRSKGSKEGKMPTPRKAIVEELIKQRKGNQKNNVLLGYKYKKIRNISETINTIANICFDILEEVSEKDIEGARKRKLKRLETIGASLDKRYHQAQSDFERAENEEARARGISAPRTRQLLVYDARGEKAPKEAIKRAEKKYIDWKQAQANIEKARKEVSDTGDKYRKNLKTWLQVKGVKV